MLNPESKQVLDILRQITGEEDIYKIVEADEIFEKLPQGQDLSKIQLSAIIKDLRDRDYLKVKYFTPDEYCLLTMKRAEEIQQIVEEVAAVANKDILPQERIPYDKGKGKDKKNATVKIGAVFMMAFFGSMLGSAIVTAIALIIQKFIL